MKHCHPHNIKHSLFLAFKHDNIKEAQHILAEYALPVPKLTILRAAVSSDNMSAVNYVDKIFSIKNTLLNEDDSAHVLSDAIKTGNIHIYTLISKNIEDIDNLYLKHVVAEAIKYSVHNGYIDIVRDLIHNKDAQLSMNLVDAICSGKKEMVRLLIDNIENLDYGIRDSMGYSLLHLALQKISQISDSYEIIIELLKHNIDINVLGPNHDNVIHIAELKGMDKDCELFCLLKSLLQKNCADSDIDVQKFLIEDVSALPNLVADSESTNVNNVITSITVNDKNVHHCQQQHILEEKSKLIINSRHVSIVKDCDGEKSPFSQHQLVLEEKNEFVINSRHSSIIIDGEKSPFSQHRLMLKEKSKFDTTNKRAAIISDNEDDIFDQQQLILNETQNYDFKKTEEKDINISYNEAINELFTNCNGIAKQENNKQISVILNTKNEKNLSTTQNFEEQFSLNKKDCESVNIEAKYMDINQIKESINFDLDVKRCGCPQIYQTKSILIDDGSSNSDHLSNSLLLDSLFTGQFNNSIVLSNSGESFETPLDIILNPLENIIKVVGDYFS